MAKIYEEIKGNNGFMISDFFFFACALIIYRQGNGIDWRTLRR